MFIDLYSTPASAQARMVLLLAKHLDVINVINVINVDLLKGEQLKPEFVAINPQHTVPTLVDGDLTLTESRAILMYLQNKYGKDESLYPKDPVARAKVDQRIFFDCTTFYPRFGDAYYPVMFSKQPMDPAKLEKVNEVLGFAELYLKDGYAVGNHLTIADFSWIATLSTIEAVGHDLSNFPNIKEYMAKMKSTIKGYDELNQKGADIFGHWYKAAVATEQKEVPN